MKTMLHLRTNPSRVGENDFATQTMKYRQTANISALLRRNPDYPRSIVDALRLLHHEIQEGHPIRPLTGSPPDYDEWARAIEEQRQKMGGELTWYNVEWFFAETYMFRLIIEAVRWFETQRDPFAPHKREELAGESPWRLLDTGLTLDGSPAEKLSELLLLALWGNRIDLSYSAALQRGAETVSVEDLLVDHRDAVVRRLDAGKGQLKSSAVHIVADNAGTELLMDMVLIDTLLAGGVNQVILHLKVHPTFVSDAIVPDVWNMLNVMRQRGGAANGLSERLHEAWSAQRFVLAPHFYWNSSRFLWDMPKSLRRTFEDAQLVILKGDANYRRAEGDTLRDVETSFDDLLGYFPAPLLALRTLKSDPIIGITAATAAALDSLEPDWRVNGQRGVIQFAGK
ncbi:MAG TPA: ARMT1-like domain-containing protein [Aggregatilineales bacterium]|nr:ARMT1-like domain-containing protein [Aggregatilineales bacterium]